MLLTFVGRRLCELVLLRAACLSMPLQTCCRTPSYAAFGACMCQQRCLPLGGQTAQPGIPRKPPTTGTKNKVETGSCRLEEAGPPGFIEYRHHRKDFLCAFCDPCQMAKPQGGGGDESSVFGTIQVLGLERWIGRVLNGGVEPVCLHAEAAVP